MPTTRTASSGPNAKMAQTQAVIVRTARSGTGALDPEGTGRITITDLVFIDATGNFVMDSIAPGVKDGQPLRTQFSGGTLSIEYAEPSPPAGMSPLAFPNNAGAGTYAVNAESILEWLYDMTANVWRCVTPFQFTT